MNTIRRGIAREFLRFLRSYGFVLCLRVDGTFQPQTYSDETLAELFIDESGGQEGQEE